MPVAWSGSGGSAEVIRSSGGGLLYHKQEGNSLAEILKNILSMSDSLRMEMIKRGRAWLREYCGTERFTHSMFELWEEVLDR